MARLPKALGFTYSYASGCHAFSFEPKDKRRERQQRQKPLERIHFAEKDVTR